MCFWKVWLIWNFTACWKDHWWLDLGRLSIGFGSGLICYVVIVITYFAFQFIFDILIHVMCNSTPLSYHHPGTCIYCRNYTPEYSGRFYISPHGKYKPLLTWIKYPTECLCALILFVIPSVDDLLRVFSDFFCWNYHFLEDSAVNW